MALKRSLARLAKLLVDREGISFDAAQARLEAWRLEIVLGADATTPAAQAALFTAVAVGTRSFVGGVSLRGAVDLPLNTTLPLTGPTLGAAAKQLGAQELHGPPAARIVIGTDGNVLGPETIRASWDGWRAGAGFGALAIGDGNNPLAGIAAGALAVGAAFRLTTGGELPDDLKLDLWPTASGQEAPAFADIYLPAAFWLIGLGNLGQAYLWALAALPYANPGDVSLVLQDHDRVSEENWATSILVHEEIYGLLKTKVGEAWAERKGFSVRRVDRKLLPGDRLDQGDPCLALSGVDKITVRESMAKTGFACVVDAGLGHDARTFDRYRVTVFQEPARMATHFNGLDDPKVPIEAPAAAPYQALLAEVGQCGTVEIAGSAIATPFVSAVAAAVAISRLIALASGRPLPVSEVGYVSAVGDRRTGPTTAVTARGILHAGHPRTP